MKQEYINKINELASQCNDLLMLDLIYQLLNKTQNEATN